MVFQVCPCAGFSTLKGFWRSDLAPGTMDFHIADVFTVAPLTDDDEKAGNAFERVVATVPGRLPT